MPSRASFRCGCQILPKCNKCRCRREPENLLAIDDAIVRRTAVSILELLSYRDRGELAEYPAINSLGDGLFDRHGVGIAQAPHPHCALDHPRDVVRPQPGVGQRPEGGVPPPQTVDPGRRRLNTFFAALATQVETGSPGGKVILVGHCRRIVPHHTRHHQRHRRAVRYGRAALEGDFLDPVAERVPGAGVDRTQ